MDIYPAKETVILQAKKAYKTKSGIMSVQTGRDVPEIGVVYKVGEGQPPLAIKAGDTIVYRKYTENKMFLPDLGQEYNFVDFKDILAVVK